MNKLSIEDLLQGRTLEETVDHALRAVVKQGVISGSQGTCWYRHPEDSGIRCVVGHMIPDSMYEDTMDTVPYNNLRNLIADHPYRRTLRQIQRFHDQSVTVDDMLRICLREDSMPWLTSLVQHIIDDKESGRL